MTTNPSFATGTPSRLLSGRLLHRSGPQGHSLGSQQYCIILRRSFKSAFGSGDEGESKHSRLAAMGKGGKEGPRPSQMNTREHGRTG